MNITYKSTRNHMEEVSASKAILKGLAEDGGLYVPTAIPKLEVGLKELSAMSYQEVAYTVMKQYLSDFTEEELKSCIAKAYDEKFDTKDIAPLTNVDGMYFLELFHGATIAFKDMALSILPHLLTTSARKNNIQNEIVILTATSGDTGKAALAGFADVKGTKIVVFYPKNGVSAVQELQMVTQKGDNTQVIGVHGNFDDCQTGVKNMFNNKDLARELEENHIQLSSANSINIGRLVPQIVYYVYAWSRLFANGEITETQKFHTVVPTGNFGNILAAYYAKTMGVPIDKLICASNENKVLCDFFETGVYDRNREFILTSSPSMDILISSNLERLIYQIADFSDEKNRQFMDSLSLQGSYTITKEMNEKLEDFVSGYATEVEVNQLIRTIYEKNHYVIDTHTAVAAAVYEAYRLRTGDTTKAVIASTASPYKFARSVMTAIGSEYDTMSDFELIDKLCEISGVNTPKAIEEIRTAPVLHHTVCEIFQMEQEVKNFLHI